MIDSDPLVLPPAAAAAAKAWLRVERSDEDSIIGGLMFAAAELCEAFIGQAILVREQRETLLASAAWLRLGRTPVRAVTAVEAVPESGAPAPLDPGAYAIDIDANADGWIRVTSAAPRRVRVTYQAGLAAGWDQLPAALKQGMVRLAAHSYTHRSEETEREPPAAVTALWRPFRRLRLG
jgi:uncharacterized phiE125 gp8 family phage protein